MVGGVREGRRAAALPSSLVRGDFMRLGLWTGQFACVSCYRRDSSDQDSEGTTRWCLQRDRLI